MVTVKKSVKNKQYETLNTIKNITIRIPSDVYEKLEEFTRYSEESKSAYIVRVLQELFNDNEYEPH